MNAQDFIADIPRDVAQSAHNGTSWTPETRAEQEQNGYAAEMVEIWNELNAFARNEDEQARVAAFFPRFRDIMRRLRLEYLHSRSNVVSWAVAGPSNFPARRMEKRARWAHNKLEHMLAVKAKLLKRIRRDLRPELRPIMAGDGDACERLREKIEHAERLQAHMKETNATIRKHAKSGDASQMEALQAMGHSAGAARRLLTPDFCGRIGYADFELTNNNANLRRMKQRLEGISRNRNIEASERESDGIRLEDCPADNRVRLFFPGKPDDAARTKLKSRGFRWTPSLGCWQAYRNPSSLAVAAEFVPQNT